MSKRFDAYTELLASHERLRVALESLQDGFFASLQSAAEAAPGNPWKNTEYNPTISVPVDLIRLSSEFIAEALAQIPKGE